MEPTSRRTTLAQVRVCALVTAGDSRRRVPALLAGGLRMVQLRDETASDRERLAAARWLAGVCGDAGALLIVNDRVDLALAADADGVHLGTEDLPLADARALLGPTRLIGGTAHDDGEVEAACAAGADYLGLGCCYPSSTKPELARGGLALIARQARRLDRPWLAIGGITIERLPELRALGVRAVAVGGALDVDDPAAAVRAFRAGLGSEA